VLHIAKLDQSGVAARFFRARALGRDDATLAK
jgi:hypothetical protein